LLQYPRALPNGPETRHKRLSELQRHVLRVACRRCERIVEIQKADAVRLYGPQAVWKEVAQRLLDNTGPQRTGRHEEDGCWPTVRLVKALNKELGKARAMTGILEAQSAEMRAKAVTMLQQADRLLCESWNERTWADGEPIDPSPTIAQAINGGFARLEIRCSRCKTLSDVDLAEMKHPPTTFVHDLASRLRCRKCAEAGRRPAASLLQLG
jgi:phage FluMu protein Com